MPIPIIGAGPGAGGTPPGGGSTLRELRSLLADEIGFLQSTVVTGSAEAGEAARLVLADELRDDEAGYLPLTRPWVYVRTGAAAGSQRRVLGGAPGQLGPYGALVVSRPFAGVVGPGSAIDVTAPLPVKTHLGIRGLDACLNEGLTRIWVEAIVAIDGGGSVYDLSAYPIAAEDQLVGLVDLSAASCPPLGASPADGFRLEHDPLAAAGTASASFLVTERPYPTGTPLGLAVLLRADRLIRTAAGWVVTEGATWGGGLVDDDDAVACPPSWAVTFGAVRALLFLRRWIGTRPDLEAAERAAWLAEIGARLSAKAAAAGAIALLGMPRPRPERARPLVGDPVGPAGFR